MGRVDISEVLRRRVVSAATSPFGHADYPLARTLDHRGDPGLFGPGSVSWKVVGDTSAFAGGIRALLIQAAHPEVAAGVDEHSRYREDPLGRLSRTSAYVTATTYGAIPEVEAAVDRVRQAHLGVSGRSHRSLPYAASDPGHAAWVHNVLTDSFLATYQQFGPGPLDRGEADRFVREQAEIGRMLDAEPLPTSAGALREWVAEHPDLGPSPGMRRAVEFLTRPPLSPGQQAGYRLLQAAATATIPPRIRGILGIRTPPASAMAGRAAVFALRWALGASPSWRLALLRTGGSIPEGLFKQRPAAHPGPPARDPPPHG